MRRYLAISALLLAFGSAAYSQSSVKICKAPPTSVTIYYDDDFETGVLTDWDEVVNVTDTTVGSTIFYGGAKALQIHYNQAAGAPASQDKNRYVTWYATNHGFSTGLTHYFQRGRIYLATPITTSGSIQRKILYVSPVSGETKFNQLFITTDDGVLRVTYADGVHTQYNYDNAADPGSMACYSSTGSTCRTNNPTFWKVAQSGTTLAFDTWYHIQLEVQFNTPGSRDGIIRLWLNGTLIYEQLTASMRATGATTAGDGIRFGVQMNRVASQAVEEYRYWDDVAITDGYVYP